MKLPSHILRQVQWFEHYFEQGYHTGNDGVGTRFVLHFKPWWMPRKTIYLVGYVTTGESPRWVQSAQADELLAQLKVQCPDQA